jgi:Phosphotransferase enzyme family
VIQPAGIPGQRIGTNELRAALQEALSRRSGTQQRIVGLERRPSAYSTSFAIEEMDVRLQDGTTLQLLFKDLSRHLMLESARRFKPAFLYDPMREIETYRTILEPSRLGTAACYGIIVDHRAGRYGLFMEKVPGLELYQVGDLATWKRVAEWLAAMHTRFAGQTGSLAQASRLLRYDATFYRRWIDRARTSLRRVEPPLPRDAWRGMEQLARNYDRVIERLTELPVTFIHGEFYASNVLVHEGGEGLRVCPVDWEMAAVGPGLIDLAALTAGGWTAGEKTALSMAYYAGLAPHPVGRWADPEEFLLALDHCRLHLAVQWLGWASGWSSPPEHAQDWLGEALGLADKLGLA